MNQKEYNKKYYEENRKRILERHKEYYRENIERFREYNQQHKERIKLNRFNRKHKKLIKNSLEDISNFLSNLRN